MKPVTIADVARHAGVSKSTVSQYLNKRYEYMSEETKERIGMAIEELGYKPNIVARSLKQKATSTIGLVVANVLHAFTTQITRSVEEVCQQYDFNLMICNADDEPEKEKKHIEMLRAKQIDGIIVFPTGGNLDLYQKLTKENYPLVFVDRILPGVSVPAVLLDNVSAARMAVQHFIDNGYERIGIVTPPILRGITPRVERIEGYKKALEENGLPVDGRYIKSVVLDRAEEGIEEMFSLEDPPQAVLAANDLTLIELLKYAKKNRLKIPKDLAVIGIDDVSFASFFDPPITTVAQPAFEMGRKAAELLLAKIRKQEEKEQHPTYRFEPKLIIRESC